MVVKRASKAVRKTSRYPRRVVQTGVDASTKVVDAAVNGVHRAFKKVTSGTRELSRAILALEKTKKARRRRKKTKRKKTQRKKR